MVRAATSTTSPAQPHPARQDHQVRFQVQAVSRHRGSPPAARSSSPARSTPKATGPVTLQILRNNVWAPLAIAPADQAVDVHPRGRPVPPVPTSCGSSSRSAPPSPAASAPPRTSPSRPTRPTPPPTPVARRAPPLRSCGCPPRRPAAGPVGQPAGVLGGVRAGPAAGEVADHHQRRQRGRDRHRARGQRARRGELCPGARPAQVLRRAGPGTSVSVPVTFHPTAPTNCPTATNITPQQRQPRAALSFTTDDPALPVGHGGPGWRDLLRLRRQQRAGAQPDHQRARLLDTVYAAGSDPRFLA